MMNNELDASPFALSEDICLKEFKKVLKLLVYCYEQILTDEKFIRKECPYHFENYLRDVLVTYLVKNREVYDTWYFLFLPEVGEISLGDNITRIDINVYNIGLKDSVRPDEDTYFAFECKRLESSSNKITAYLDDGLSRFISGTYSKEMHLAGMIGFIEKDDPLTIIGKIDDKIKSNKISTLKSLTHYNITKEFKYSYLSQHQREKNLGIIDIYHLMFDYSNIIHF